MKRSSLTLLGAAALAAACVDLGALRGTASLGLTPVLDSIFVGDRSLAHRVSYVDEHGNPQSAGTVVWASSDSSVALVSSTGAVTGLKRGVVLITASAQGLTAGALEVISDTLDITLLMDTVYVLPGDTLTVPVVVLKRTTPPAPAVWFTAPANGSFTIDSATGRLTASAVGGPSAYVVHADAIADTGAVYVMQLTDTTSGKMFYSVRGTVVSHVGGPAEGINFVATGGKQAFQLRGSYFAGGSRLQTLQIILPDSVVAADTTFVIDSLNPSEDQLGSAGAIAICSPPRAWALWQAQTRSIFGYSRPGGALGITQIVPMPDGQAVSGRFRFTAQRTDLPTDPLGALAITGSFVAPLVRSTTICH